MKQVYAIADNCVALNLGSDGEMRSLARTICRFISWDMASS